MASVRAQNQNTPHPAFLLTFFPLPNTASQPLQDALASGEAMIEASTEAIQRELAQAFAQFERYASQG